MCGIVGIIDKNKKSTEEDLHKMSNALTHRGPDFGNYLLTSKGEVWVGSGHRRLAIIDTSPDGNQPMQFNHLTIVFNGEIYNYKSIRNELMLLGHSFKTECDTEVILHAFYEWGVQFIDKCVGMFALCIHDEKSQSSYLFRDRVGVKPLYYYLDDQLFLFSSELKSFFVHPSFKKNINQNALLKYFQYGNVPGKQAIFKNTFKLLPGYFMEIKWEDFSIKFVNYWDVKRYFKLDQKNISYQEAKIQTHELLKETIVARTVSDVPIGVFLSSGYDSSLVSAVLQKNSSDSIRTYTVSVPSIGLNEAPDAKKIASFLGTKHSEIQCNIAEALEVIDLLPIMYDEPFADSSAIPTYLVSKFARNEITVALSADGGDELFGGYNRYLYYQKAALYLNKLPKSFRTIASKGIKKSYPWFSDFFSNELMGQRVSKFSDLLANNNIESYMANMTKSVSDEQVGDYFAFIPELDSNDFLNEYSSSLSYMMCHDITHYLPDDILQKVDRATMAVGLEGREPLLDHRLIEWVAQLPDAYKCTAHGTKILLKDIVHDYIPKELLSKKKKGFAIPINEWMRNHLRDRLLGYCEPIYLEKQGLFNTRKIQQMVDDFLKGSDREGLKTWYFFNFQLWYTKWM